MNALFPTEPKTLVGCGKCGASHFSDKPHECAPAATFSPPTDPLAELLIRLRRTNISSEDMAVAIREKFIVDERPQGGCR